MMVSECIVVLCFGKQPILLLANLNTTRYNNNLDGNSMYERSDERSSDELRPINIIRHFTKNAPGSVLVSYGDTRVLVTASVEERVPRHVQQSDEENAGWLTAEYAMLPASTHSRSNRERNKISGRSNEIQRLIGRCLRASLDLNNLGNRTIIIDADVIQADGGTRVAAITGGYVAMVDALRHIQSNGLLETLPELKPVAAVSVGIIEGSVILDLNYEEDYAADVDANVIMNCENEIIEFQASCENEPFTRESMVEMFDLAHSGISKLLELQELALAESVEVAV